MSIEWGKQAWDEISSDTIIKCFKRTGLYPEAEVEEDEDDPFEGDELSSLQLLVNSLNASCPVQEFVCCDDKLEVCSSLVDPSDPEWRAKEREEVLVQNDQDPEIQEKFDAKASCVDDEEEKESEIKSDRKRYKWPKSFANMYDLKGMRSFRSSCLNQQICFRK